MPSPFPGMNPYLEQAGVWHDFHEAFLPAARAHLTPQLGARYVARIDEHVYIHEVLTDDRRFVGRSDLGVAARGPDGGASAAAVRLPEVDQERESFIEIRDRQNRELVTVIELLSPSYKRPGKDREQYLTKRHQLLAAGVNLVEIDLLRGGPRMPMDGLPKCDYCVMTSRPELWPMGGLWALNLRDTLPVILVPLRAGDASVRLDLKALIDQVYDAANYSADIYDDDPDPPLAPEDAAWAAQFVPARSE